jgi:hypothetical protein
MFINHLRMFRKQGPQQLFFHAPCLIWRRIWNRIFCRIQIWNFLIQIILFQAQKFKIQFVSFEINCFFGGVERDDLSFAYVAHFVFIDYRYHPY